ncbi:MAG: aconitase X catalytic domain-containing protein [Ectothiorhodospiraceae bacterium]|nr:aconitase X catalytic domain-containing protein [Chromatiales bacterium]MCP5156405.1 aconitase X catalytic domain-containing protein [Ectothiorhodospiraceae bacterium]
MRLNEIEQAMLAGELGAPRQQAIEQQMAVGRMFDAPDFVEVSHVHVMGDTESLGEAGVAWLEQLATAPREQRRVRVPTVTDPRGIDQCAFRRLKQPESMAALELRAAAALRELGVLMTDTCINYQTVLPPVRGEHLAYGDTGSTIYANSVCGARSNFEGGPAALAAGLTGRVPRYGCHLDAGRRGTHLFEVRERPRNLTEWGALGAVIGRAAGSYWTVPVITGIDGSPTSDELKHFGAAMASWGSVPLFHMVGVTPEAPDLASVLDGPAPAATTVGLADIEALYAAFGRHEEKVDVVVFAAPQLSLVELQQLAELLRERRVHEGTALLVATSPELKAACDRMGITETIEASGAVLLQGVCFYQMYARELGVANGWTRLLSNSAKLVNIISGYGYEPVLAPMEVCVEAAVAGRMA